mmetsp:Transcript_42459/g.107945  ORF Transcript_42459/g.107945 Transcript_42459/m.107945 type:complete len:159 (-) Transcript_42459:30-506(-)
MTVLAPLDRENFRLLVLMASSSSSSSHHLGLGPADAAQEPVGAEQRRQQRRQGHEPGGDRRRSDGAKERQAEVEVQKQRNHQCKGLLCERSFLKRLQILTAQKIAGQLRALTFTLVRQLCRQCKNPVVEPAPRLHEIPLPPLRDPKEEAEVKGGEHEE